MAIADEKSSNGKVWSLCKMPFWQSGGNNNSNVTSSSTSSSSTSQQPQHHHHHNYNHNQQQHVVEGSSNTQSSNTVISVARSLIPTRRRLRLDPATKLYFPCKHWLS